MRWKTGDTNIGLFKEGKFDGQGVMTWASGASYEWENDKNHGQGTEKWANDDGKLPRCVRGRREAWAGRHGVD